MMFACPTAQYAMDSKEEHLWMVPRKSEGKSAFPNVQQVGSPRVISAGSGLNPEIVGKWTTAVYDVPENVLIKVMLMRSSKMPPSQKAANILIRMRNSAAMRRITVNTIPNAKSAMDRLIVEGKFDIVDLGQAAELGFRPNQQYALTYMQSRWGNLPYLSISEMTRETATAPRVVRQRVRNSEGETVEVASAHRKRALDL
jgi:hypothetical protein